MSGRSWTKDEDILVMDAYVSGVRKRKDDSRFGELCELLDRTSDNSVSMRLDNFKASDPAHPGEGLKGGRKHQKVWDEFAEDRDKLRSTAKAIKQHIEADQNSGGLQDTESMGLITEAPEGAILTRSHIFRERKRTLVRKKKESVLRETGRLLCEACGFDFVEKYGERGEGFIECHHTKPLRDLKPGSTTRLNDLVLLCSNCHSMVHKEPWLEIKELVRLIKSAKRGGRARKNAPKRRKG